MTRGRSGRLPRNAMPTGLLRAPGFADRFRSPPARTQILPKARALSPFGDGFVKSLNEAFDQDIGLLPTPAPACERACVATARARSSARSRSEELPPPMAR